MVEKSPMLIGGYGLGEPSRSDWLSYPSFLARADSMYPLFPQVPGEARCGRGARYACATPASRPTPPPVRLVTGTEDSFACMIGGVISTDEILEPPDHTGRRFSPKLRVITIVLFRNMMRKRNRHVAITGGGGALLVQGQLHADHCILTSNTATGGGGGVMLTGPVLSLTDCRLEGNGAGGSGGGIHFSFTPHTPSRKRGQRPPAYQVRSRQGGHGIAVDPTI
jgi:hypothetical protein